MPTRARQRRPASPGTPGQVRRQGSQEPAHRLGVNSSQWELAATPSALSPAPSPSAPPRGMRVSQLVGGVSIPHLCPYWVGVCGWLTEGGPQRIFVLQTRPPNVSSLVLGRRQGSWNAEASPSSDPSQMPWPLFPRAHAGRAEQSRAAWKLDHAPKEGPLGCRSHQLRAVPFGRRGAAPRSPEA